MKWFGQYNGVRELPDQVKPFNFLNSFQARPQFELSHANQSAITKRGRPRKQVNIKPIAPFNRDVAQAAHNAFDRETGKAVAPALLVTYAEALAQYHLRPEAKFLNGEHMDRGLTERRHIIAAQILHIGKESNKWEERYFVGDDADEAEIEYGVRENGNSLDVRIRGLTDQIGERSAAQQLGISRTALRRALKLGTDALSRSVRSRPSVRLFDGLIQAQFKKGL